MKKGGGTMPEINMPNEKGLVRLDGSVETVIYSNEDNGYAICDFGTEDDDLVTIVGTLPYVSEGDTLAVYGHWVHNPKYGRQFKVEEYEKNRITLSSKQSGSIKNCRNFWCRCGIYRWRSVWSSCKSQKFQSRRNGRRYQICA